MPAFPFAAKWNNTSTTARLPKSPRNISLGIKFVFIVCGYMLFFLSSMIFSNGTSMLYTVIGQSQEIAPKRTVTVNSWEYSPKQKKMLVELSMRNMEYDGQNEYRFTAKSRSMSLTELPTSVMLGSPDLYVVEINNVPRDFNEVLLGVILDSEKHPGVSIPLYTNKYLVTNVSSITAKTETEYRISSIERTITGYKDEIAKQTALINEANIRIENVYIEIQAVEIKKKYMTADEMKEANRSIGERESYIATEKNSIARANDMITEYEARIELAKKEINDLEAEGNKTE